MDVAIAQETCCECRITFWITVKHQESLQKCHNIFYCPNGHPQSYKGETDTTKLERAKRQLAYQQTITECHVRSNSALRGAITKLKKKQAKM